MPYKYAKKSGLSKRLMAGIAVLVVIVVIGGLELAGVTHIFHKKTQPAASGSSFSTKGEPKSSKTTARSQSTPIVNSNTEPSSKSSPSSATLVAPSGDFVSDHHPDLSGSPNPSTMSSVCTSTPGASCQITFTMGGTVKSLPAQTADSNGSTYWDWNLQTIGLTAGTWKIQAIASLNGQTQTTPDAMDLVVGQ